MTTLFILVSLVLSIAYGISILGNLLLILIHKKGKITISALFIFAISTTLFLHLKGIV